MTELQRCSMCKCNKLLSFFKVRTNTGKILKTCIKCSERFKCSYENCDYKCNANNNLQKHIKSIHNKDYSKCVIYKIECNDKNKKDFYIGSTTNYINRQKKHKKNLLNKNHKEYNYKLYNVIRENGGFDNYNFYEIEQYKATDRHDLMTREKYWIVSLNPSLNKGLPTRTKQQWYDDNKERLSKKSKDKYENNKEAILKIKREKITCQCGAIVSIGSLHQHKKSKKHLKNVL